ncbi:MAG: DUF5667 domain-containing protein [Candidatus Magasanikbacteria bacterium]
MKKQVFTLIFAFVFLFVGVAAVQANGHQDNSFNLVDPGVLPGSPLYFVKSFSERINTLFTFGSLNKAERYSRLAEKRLAEARALAEKGKEKMVSRAIDKYQNFLKKAEKRVSKVERKPERKQSVISKIASSTMKHQAVLAEVYEKVPESAKNGIKNAINASKTVANGMVRSLPQQAQQKVRKEMEKVQMKVSQKLNELRGRGVPIPEVAGPNFGTSTQPGVPKKPTSSLEGPPNNVPGPGEDKKPPKSPRGEPKEKENNSEKVEKPSLDRVQKASSKDQCILVDDGICGCSQGGGSVAINKKYKEEWNNWLSNLKDKKGNLACPQVYKCGDYSIKYSNGRCKTSFQMNETDELESSNNKAKGEKNQNEKSQGVTPTY